MADRTLSQFEQRLHDMGTGGLVKALRREAIATALRAEAFGKTNATNNFNTGTGRLRASIKGSVKGRSDSIAIELQAGGRGGKGNVSYARMQEYGGTQRSRKAGGYLRIPLGPARNPGGSDRFPPPLRQTGAGLFHLIKSVDGRLYLFKTDSPQDGPWYVLKRSVKIPARPYLRPAMRRAQKLLPDSLRSLFTTEVLK